MFPASMYFINSSHKILILLTSEIHGFRVHFFEDFLIHMRNNLYFNNHYTVTNNIYRGNCGKLKNELPNSELPNSEHYDKIITPNNKGDDSDVVKRESTNAVIL